jgi:hypothetical protein
VSSKKEKHHIIPKSTQKKVFGKVIFDATVPLSHKTHVAVHRTLRKLSK